MSENLFYWLGFVGLTNAFFYKICSFYSNRNVSVTSKIVISTSNFCALSALIVLNVDVHQTLTQNQVYETYTFWRILYWISFVYGYIVFVALSEKERFGDSKTTKTLLVDFYKQRFLQIFLFGTILIVLIYALYIQGVISLSNLDILPKALANCWGMLLIILILGYSMINALKRMRDNMSNKKKVQCLLLQLQKSASSIEELSLILEYKIPFLLKKLEFISDKTLNQKFIRLLSELPSEISSQTHIETTDDLMKLSDEDLIEEIESEIYDFIINEYLYNFSLRRLKHILILDKNSIGIELPDHLKNSSLGLTTRCYQHVCLKIACVLFLIYGGLVSFLIVGGLFVNGFSISRNFLLDFLKSLSFGQFLIIFNGYLAYFIYLLLHGICESRLQGFKGLTPNHKTDTQSLLYFTRLNNEKYRADGFPVMFSRCSSTRS